MNKKDLIENVEKPLYHTIEEVFENSDLSEEEKSIFREYEKYCKYWLLRIKNDQLRSIYQNEKSFLKKIAIALIKLHSKNVIGSKSNFIKEMFGDKAVHRVYETKNGGLRSTINSNIIANKYFELDILSYFIDNGFKVLLSESKFEGQKIPEFKAIKNDISINVEAKRLDQEKVMDNIFGDRMVYGIDYKFTDKEKDKGFKRIESQFSRNLLSAFSKMENVPKDEFYLIFIYVYYRVDYAGKYIIDYINNVSEELSKYSNLLGLVIPDSNNTYHIKNPSCKLDYEKLFSKHSMNLYHLYTP